MGTRFEELHTGIDGPGASGDGVSEAGAGAALPRRAISRRAAALGAAGLTALAVVMTWPLPAHLQTHLVGPFGVHQDTYLTTWIVAWVARTLVTAPTRLFDGNMFHPARDALGYSEHLLGALPVTLPAYWATANPIFTHQLLFLATFVLSALAMAALVRFWTGSDLGAFVAGALFAFARWRFAYLYWLQLLVTFYAPLVVLFSSRYLRAGRRGDLLGAGACFLGQVLSSYALAYPMCAAMGVFWPVHALVLRAPLRRLVALLTVAMAAGLVLVLVSMPMLHVQRLGVFHITGEWTVARVLEWNLSPLGAWLDARAPVFPGYVSYGLALTGLGLLLHGRVARRWPIQGRALAVSLVAFAGPLVFLALGPRGGPALGWLWEHVPGLRHYRVVERFAYLVSLPTAALGGVAAAALEQRVRRAGRRGAWCAWPGGLILVAALCFEVRAPIPLLADPLPPVYTWLQGQPVGPVLEIPAGMLGPMGVRISDPRYVFWSAWHGRPIVNGYSGYAPAGYPLVTGLAAQLPGEEPLATLRRLTGVRWLVVHLRWLTPGERSRWESEAPAPVARFGDDVVFAVAPAAEDWSARYQRPPAENTLGGAPLVTLGPTDAAAVRWDDPAPVHARETTPVRLTVRNTGTQRWPALGVDPRRRVMLVLRWQPTANPTPPKATVAVLLPRDLGPGEAVTVNTVLATPNTPGRYDFIAEVRQGETLVRTPSEMGDARVPVVVS